jgi:hypothetical protein
LYVIFAVTVAGVATFSIRAAWLLARGSRADARRAGAIALAFAAGQTLAMMLAVGVGAQSADMPPARTAADRIVEWAIPYGVVTPQRIAGIRATIAPEQSAPELRAVPAADGSSQQRQWTYVAALLPRSIPFVLFAPFPWEWASEGALTGMLRRFEAAEVLLLYLLWPAFAVALWRTSRASAAAGWLIAVTAALIVVIQALVIPNLGMIVRHRLAWIVLAIILVSATDAWSVYPGWRRGLTVSWWKASVTSFSRLRWIRDH